METCLAILASNTIVAGCLAVFGVLAWRATQRSPLPHALYLLAMLKLVTPPLVDIGIVPPAAVRTAVDATAAPSPPVRGFGRAPEVAAAVPAPVVVSPATVAAPSRLELSWSTIAFGVWVFGTLLSLAHIWRRGRYCHRLLRHASVAPEHVLQQAHQLARTLRLRHSPDVRVIDAGIAPFVFAIGSRARVVLPRCLVEGASPRDLRAVLAHELAHIANRDHLTRWLEVLVIAVHWWNPLARFLRRQLDELGEMRCDARAVGVFEDGARSYGHALLRVTSQLEVQPGTMPLGASGIGGSHTLKRRIVMIAESNLTHRLNWPARCALTAGALALLPLGLTAQERKSADTGSLEKRILKALEDEGVLTDGLEKRIKKALTKVDAKVRLKDKKDGLHVVKGGKGKTIDLGDGRKARVLVDTDVDFDFEFDTDKKVDGVRVWRSKDGKQIVTVRGKGDGDAKVWHGKGDAGVSWSDKGAKVLRKGKAWIVGDAEVDVRTVDGGKTYVFGPKGKGLLWKGSKDGKAYVFGDGERGIEFVEESDDESGAKVYRLKTKPESDREPKVIRRRAPQKSSGNADIEAQLKALEAQIQKLRRQLRDRDSRIL